jgi:hypothetical protein
MGILKPEQATSLLRKMKNKVKLSLCLSKHHVIKTYWEWGYNSKHSMNSVLDGDEWSASRPGRFTPQGKGPRYPLDRRLVWPQSQSGHGVEEKRSQPPPGIETRLYDRPACSQSLYRMSCPGSHKKNKRNIKHSPHTAQIRPTDSTGDMSLDGITSSSHWNS